MHKIGVITSFENSAVLDGLKRFRKTPDNFEIIKINNNSTAFADLYLCEDMSRPENTFFKIFEDKPVIVNSSDEIALSAITHRKLYVIACGLSYKDTVTLSSIEDNFCTYCLQRGIKDLSNNLIPPQEFTVRVKDSDADVYGILSCITAFLMCGIKKEEIADFLF